MIDHVTIYVGDLERSKIFYEKVFANLGWKISFGTDGVFWAFDIGRGCLFEIAQYKGVTSLTPVHVAFRVPNIDKIKEFYQAALLAGGKDNGPPGPRPQYTANYYACFVLDPDGHNIEATFDTWPE
jgi:catechol 2,3-dioxygenase-like lactoylglutathione lyase family enzyme